MRLDQLLDQKAVKAYLLHLKSQGVPPATIDRKLASIRRFSAWAWPEKIGSDPKVSKVSWISKGSDPIGLARLYSAYSRSRFSSYLHLAILVLFSAALAVFGYNQVFKEAQIGQAFPQAPSPTTPNRYLSFQARLTDSSNNPITPPTDMRFIIYNNETASGSARLWEELRYVDPDQDGIFSVTLGTETAINSSVFTENVNLWLGVTVQKDPEATPRQRIATVGYALNAETLQGFPPSASASANQIPVLTQEGALVIAAANPMVYSSSGTFSIKGQAMTISTAAGTNGNITIAPDGLGQLLLSGSTTTQNFIRATNANLTSGHLISGYVGNGTATGDLLNLSSGAVEAEKFTVDRSGNVALAGDLTITGGNITNALTTDSTLIVTGNLTAGSTTTFGGLIYTWPGSQTSGYILQTNGSGTLTWVSPLSGSAAGWWRLNAGAISPINDTLDLLIGNTASASAKFAVLNMNSGTPVASISANSGNIATYLTGDGTLATTNKQSLTIGNSSTYNTTGNVLINSNGTGNVGIGTTGPDAKLDSLATTEQLRLTYTDGTVYSSHTVDSSGNLTIDNTGTKTIIADDLQINGGDILTGNIAFTIGDATTDAITLTTDGTGNAEIVLPNDSIGPNELFTTGQTDEYCLTYEGTGTTWEWQSCAAAGGSSNWRIASGAISPVNDTLDVLIGATATASAKFGFLNVDSGTPTASISANSGNNALFLTGLGNLATTNKQTLSLGGASTGDITFTASGDTDDYLKLYVNANIPTLTTVGNTHLVLDPDGGLVGFGGYTYYINTSGTGNLNALTLAGNLTAGGTTNFGGIAYTWPGSQTANYVLQTNGSGTLSWVAGTTAAAPAIPWIEGAGILYPKNSTVDLLVGGQATSSAKFAALNMNSGTPTASVSAGTAGGAYLTATGTLATTAKQSLTLGSSTTGNILLNPASNHFTQIQNNAGGAAAFQVDQLGSGDVMAASVSGTTVFRVDTSGYAHYQRYADLANSAYYLDPAATGVGLAMASGSLTSATADSATAVGFTFNTTNTLSSVGAKLLSIQNNSTEKFYIDKDGNLYVSGTLMSGNGTSMLLTNKSGGTVATRSVVVLDTSNNTSFTTTTTPYNKAGFGVVVGVGLGVTNDADGDGACDANDICMIAYGGSVNVTVKNATTAVKGDYLFTSDTAGSAVASAKQYDGLVGIVDDTTNSASGYLKMIFKVQPQVTAAAAIDKTTKHNEYWLYADQYQAVGEGANTDTNLLQRGLAFDTFTDSTKTDSANTTTSFDTNTQKTGLIGGQTMSTATTDNDGQTYLGSNTVNDTFYYDRVPSVAEGEVGSHSGDSSPQVQVELGIDPNWYNGVTLSVATTSAQFSQNSVITQKNPNLSTSYNGSLIKVTGTDTTPRTIYITIKSPTTFDWTNYQGDAATGVTITFGTAQALGTTGVSVTFTNARYNTGDVFKIASWFIEAESATRGAKQQFPERSTIIATASSVDIIDADTQKLWMRFSQGTSYAIGVDANNDPSSANMLNGKTYISTNGSAATGLYTLDFAHDAAFKQNATDYRLSDTALYGRNAANTYNVINTSNILVNVTANDVSAAVIPNQPTQEVTVTGWGYMASGGGGQTQLSETVNLPYKFNAIPTINVSFAGYTTSAPTNLGSCNTMSINPTAALKDVTTTSFTSVNNLTSGTYGANNWVCYTWTATGQVSPRQYVAAATDGGVSVINETDQSVTSKAQEGTYKYSKIVMASNSPSAPSGSTLYIGRGTPAGYGLVDVYYNVPTLTSTALPSNVRYYNSPGGGTFLNTLANSSTSIINSLSATVETSTIDGKSNTLYIGTDLGLTVLQEKQSGANTGDGSDEINGSVKYYTKDYISEEMVGDIRGMWPLNASNTASDLEDVSVKANALTATNITSADAVSGVRGEATDFDGSTEYLSIANNSSIDLSSHSSMSLGSWFKTGSASSQALMYKGYTGSVYPMYAFVVNTYSAGKISFCMAITSGASQTCVTSSTTVNDNLWHHSVGTYDGTNMYLYIDGKLEGSAARTGAIYNYASASLAFGAALGASPSIYFTGAIDESFLTTTTATAGQIKNMYQVGYRALQSHATTLGGGAADANQQLGYISTGTNSIGAARPDYNNQFMYVGTNSTTLGAVSKIDLNSDTNIKTYNSSANVPTGGPLLIDEDTKSLAVGYNLEAVGSATGGVKTMGVDNNATATSGNFIGKTVTTAESFTQTYLWAQYTLDASDASNTIQVWASNDGGSNYSQCNLTNTDTSRSPSEYEYFCQFNTAGSSLKTKFVMARGSTKTNTWVSKYGIAWIDSSAVAGAANGSGLFTGSNASVANGSYIDVAHNQNSNDVVTNGWVYNTATSKWEQIDKDSSDATGGTITYSGGYTIHTFTSSGTFTPPNAGNVEYLVVGGGGGGGGNNNNQQPGGGGAGGYQAGAAFAVTPQAYTITVGAGGVGGVGGVSSPTNGGNSVFSSITSTGGGTGATVNSVPTWVAASSGGSGGGGGGGSLAGAAGTAGQGNAGGTTTGGTNGSGGGGSGGVGASNTGSQTNVAGGVGTSNTISGAAVTYAAGGTGGATATTNGGANTGNGGSGGTTNGGAGGSGIVIIRYLTNSLSAFKITQVDANTARLYNYSGATQNLRLDVITGGLGRNAGTVSLAPAAADVDSAASTNSIWLNKTGSGGNLLKLQTSGTDVLSLAGAGTMTLTGNFLPGTDNTYSLGASSSARFKDLFLGPASLHIQSKSTDTGYPALGLDYALGINTAGSLVTSLNGTTNPLMTITQAGNVGIGTTTPTALLDIAGAAGASTSGTLSFRGTTDPKINILNGEAFGIQTSVGGDAGLAEKFTVTNAGGVGIGTTSPGYKLDVAGNARVGLNEDLTPDASGLVGQVLIDGNGYGGFIALDTTAMRLGHNSGSRELRFQTDETDRVTIQAGGNVGIGTTAPSGKLDVFTADNQAGITTKSTYSDYATIMNFLAANGSQKGSITGTPTSVAYNTTSDLRLKENIIDTSLGLDVLKQISIKDFNFISDPEKMKTQGFIAQELYKIYPYAVTVGGDDPEKNPWGVDYGKLTPLLVKGIQEQQVQISSLSGQLANLSLTDAGDLNIEINHLGGVHSSTSEVNFSLTNSAGEVVKRIGAFAEVAAANIKAGYVHAQALTVAGYVQTKELIADTVTVNNKILAPTVETEKLVTNFISPLTADGIVTIQGNASVSGTLVADRVVTKELVAENVKAGTIEGLRDKIEDIVANLNLTSEVGTSFTSEVAMESAIDVNTLNAIYQLLESRPATNSAEYADVAFIEAEGAFFSDYLAVLGTATITDLRVTNSITLAKITGLNGSVDLAGNLNISGDLTVTGNVNILGSLAAPTASFGALLAQRLEVNEAKIDQLTTNQLIIAASTSEESSSATSEVASNSASIATNATAGKAVLPAGLTEYTIYNPRVDADSLVYVTPTGDPRNQVLYVKSKKTCSTSQEASSATSEVESSEPNCSSWFKVAINQALPDDLEFNWWIIKLSN